MFKKKFFGEAWTSQYNPLILKVLKKYNSSKFIFALTGDLDNLGLYVARNGRAKAENLVDHYNQTIRNILQGWANHKKNEIDALCFIPAGEEVFILGVSKNTEAPKDLIRNLKGAVLARLKKYEGVISIGETLPNFGGYVSKENLKSKIDKFLKSVKKQENIAYKLYLELMEFFRDKTSIELDRNKFADVFDGDYPIQLRNLVFAQMINYKKSTKKIIKTLSNKKELSKFIEVFGDKYGFKNGKEANLNLFLGETDYFKSLKKNLVLIGGGVLRNNETKKIDKYILEKSGKKNPKVLFIPANSNKLVEYIEDFSKHYNSLSARTRSLNLFSKKISTEIIKKYFKWADIIYLGGGNPRDFIEKIKEYNLKNLIKDSLDYNKIIVGLSAGAGVLFEQFLNFDKEYKNKELIEGLGLIEGICIPHFKRKVLHKYSTDSFPVFLIPDKGALIFNEMGFPKSLEKKCSIGFCKNNKFYFSEIK